eukprot:gene13957-17205_t
MLVAGEREPTEEEARAGEGVAAAAAEEKGESTSKVEELDDEGKPAGSAGGKARH